MNISIKTIPHKDQRYPTCGDWWWKGDTLHLRVSDVGDWRMEMAVAIHEMTEALLCKYRGVKEEEVDAFDKGPGARCNEPGDHPKAPYRREHRAAYVPEFFLLDALDVGIKDYNDALDNLD